MKIDLPQKVTRKKLVKSMSVKGTASSTTKRKRAPKSKNVHLVPLPATEAIDPEFALAEKRARACALRRAGATYRQIAADLRVALGTAHQYVKAVLRELQEDANESLEEMVAIEEDRLDLALAAIQSKVKAGDLKAVREWVRLSESRRRLLGLDKAIKIEQTGNGGMGGLRVIEIPGKATSVEAWGELAERHMDAFTSRQIANAESRLEGRG